MRFVEVNGVKIVAIITMILLIRFPSVQKISDACRTELSINDYMTLH